MWLKIIALVLALAVTGVAGAIAVGAWRWRSMTTAFVARLASSRSEPVGAGYDEKELGSLPEPVARYFRAVLRNGQPFVVSAHIVQEGQFRMSEADDSWRPFTATQFFSARPPGFVWDACIRMAPALRVRVRDAYVAGTGSMRGEILGLVRVVDAHGTREIATASLQRYLAEAPWVPTALLPVNGIQWTAIDDSSARATLTDGTASVSVEFRFNEAGEITSVYAPSRYREVRGAYEAAPWEGRFTGYSRQGGMRIPMEGEVAWLLPGGRLPYWRGRLKQVAYEYNRQHSAGA